MNIKNNTTSLQALLEQAQALPDAITLDTLSNEGASADLLAGKELLDSEGKKVTGTIPTKTASNLTASGATVTVPAGYYSAQATKSVATATQATPSVSIDSAGKITATSTQSAGYVSAGTKSATKQLTVQAAKTITPTKSSQTAVASGRYTTGTVTVAAIPSQYEDITTPLADLNTLNGGIAATTMSAAVDNTETLANSQESLISQIAAALEGKAAGGGDSGGGSAETCTVRLQGNSDTRLSDYAYTCVENGTVVHKLVRVPTSTQYASFDVTIENVLVRSMLVVDIYERYSLGFICDNAENIGSLEYACTAIFSINAPAGGTATIYADGDY